MVNALTTAGTALKALLLRAASVVETCGAKNRFAQRLLPRFSRITSGGTFMPEIDGLRFVAISWVFMLHLYGSVWHFTAGTSQSTFADRLMSFFCLRGNIGVPLFFIISGFILGMPFAKHYLCESKPVSLPKYFLRRVTRLEPPYIIHLIILSLLFVSSATLGLKHVPVYSDDTPLMAALKHGLASLCYQHRMIFGVENPINSVLWSLEVEIQFYLLVPLLALVFAIRSVAYRRLVIVSIIVVFTCFSLTPWARMYHRVWETILTELQWFMTGFLLVDIMLATPAEQLKPKLRWDLISLFGWCTLILCEACRTPSRFSCEAHPVIYGLTVPAAFLAYLGVFRGQVVGAFFRNPWISTIGGMCYTIYMYHYFILRNSAHYALPLLNTQIFHWNLLIQIVVSGSIVLSICAVLFLYCERPFMQRDWPQKAWASGRRLYLTVTGQQPR